MIFWKDALNYGLLALLFVILYAALSMMDICELQARRISESQDPDDIEVRINAWHDARIFFFQHSNMIQEPTLWMLQLQHSLDQVLEYARHAYCGDLESPTIPQA